MLAADQLTKLWIRSSLDVGGVMWEAGIFSIVRNSNTGSAFGLFQDYSLAIAIVATVAAIALVLYVLFGYRRFPVGDNRWSMVALGLMLAGIVGNLIERVLNLIDPARFVGVTDFISVGWWPSFNVADSALVVGTILLALLLLMTVFKQDSLA